MQPKFFLTSSNFFSWKACALPQGVYSPIRDLET